MTPLQQVKSQDFSRMNFSPNLPSLASGSPMLDMTVGMMLQTMNASPVPGAGQSVYDSYLQRERSRSYINMMQRGVAESLVAQKMGGINTSSMAGSIVSMIAGQPDGIMDSRFMRAFNGGNPIKAMMGLNANFTGQTLAMAFGGAGEAAPDQVNSMFNAMRGSLFQSKRITSDDYNRVRSQGSKDLRSNLTGIGTNMFDDLFDKSGNFDQEKFKRDAEKYAKKAKDSANEVLIKAYEDVLSTSKGMDDFKGKIGTSVLSRTDPRKMMGFQLDDLTKAFATAADLGMSYSSDRFSAGKDLINSSDMADTAKAFSNNAGGLLRAVSELTGNTSADGAMGDLNSLLGNAQLNFGNSDETTQLEGLVRKFKGAARAAGISVEAVMDILKTTRDITSQFGSLKFEGGTASIESVTKSVNTGTALMASLGPDWVRRNGGPAGVQSNTSNTAAVNKTEAIHRQHAAIIGQISSSTILSDSQKEQLYAELSAASNDPSRLSPGGFSATLSSMSSKMGMSTFALASVADTEVMQQVGFEFLANRERAGKAIDLNPAKSLSVREAQLALTMAAEGSSQQIRENGGVLSSGQRVNRFFEELGKGGSANALLARYGLTGQYTDELFSGSNPRSQFFVQNLTEYAAEKYNPRFESALRQQRGATSGYAANSMAMAKRLAHLHTPFLDNLAQELISGNFSDGMNSLSGVLLTPGSIQRSTDMLNSARNLRTEGTMESFKKLYQDLHGGVGDLSEDQVKKNLADIHLTDPAYAKRAMAIRGSLSDANFANLSEVSNSLTLNQIKNGATNYKGSAAEKAGISKDKLISASKFLTDSNMEASGIFSKFGDKKFNEIFSEFGHGMLMREMANISATDAVKDIETSTDTDFEKALTELQTPLTGTGSKYNTANKAKADKILGVLKGLGLVTYGEQGEWTNIDAPQALKMISDDRFLKGATEESIMEQINSGSLDPAMKARLEVAQIGSTGAGGKFKLDKNKFKAQVEKEKLISELESSSEILKSGAVNINAARGAGDAAAESAEGKFEKSIKEFQTSLGSNATAITAAIVSLNNTLSKLGTVH